MKYLHVWCVGMFAENFIYHTHAHQRPLQVNPLQANSSIQRNADGDPCKIDILYNPSTSTGFAKISIHCYWVHSTPPGRHVLDYCCVRKAALQPMHPCLEVVAAPSRTIAPLLVPYILHP